MSETDHLLVDVSDGVMTLTMNRPDAMNSISPEMAIRMADAWVQFRDDNSLRCAIVTGAGSDAFCTGADLKLLAPLMTGARSPENDWDAQLVERGFMPVAEMILRNFELHKPVIAAVNGAAHGGGTEMIQAMDLRVAAETAEFCLPEVKRGLVPGGGSITRLPHQIPWAIAAEIMLVGDPITPRRAYEIGLVNRVVAPEDLLDTARDLADRIAANGPLAVRKVKEGMIRGSGLTLDESMQIEGELSVEVFASKDAREGPRAFKEKRKPNFTGT